MRTNSRIIDPRRRARVRGRSPTRHALHARLLPVGRADATRGLPLGIDFSGGTLVIVEFAQQGVTEDEVRNAVAALPGDEVVQRYGPADERRFLIRLPLADEKEQSLILEAGARHVTEALQAANLPAFQRRSSRSPFTPSGSRERQGHDRAVAGECAEPERQPDARAYGHHGGDYSAQRALAVSVWRGSPARVCVHDARRDRERHVFNGFHRLVDCDAVELPHAAAAGRSGGGRPLGLTVGGQPTEVA